MDDNGETILLCLVNNDPCSTVLMTTSGQPLYSVTTPNARPAQPTTSCRPTEDRAPRGSLSTHSGSSSPQSECTNSWLQDELLKESGSASSSQDSDLPVTADCHVRRGSETFVRRLDEIDITTGLVERTVGTIKEAEDETVTLELPGERNFALAIPHLPRQTKTKSLPQGRHPACAVTERIPEEEDSSEDDERRQKESSGIECV